MKVFITWSGQRSRAVAEVIRKWLPGVLQAVKPYFSPDDVAKGTRWFPEVAKELDASGIGLLCVTRENLTAPWLLFEAGALGKNLDESKVCPLLFGVEPTDLTGPLSQFQGARFQKGEFKQVVEMINSEIAEGGLPSDVLDSVFDMWWPELEEQITEKMKEPHEAQEGKTRSDRDILEEILQLSRGMARSPQLGGLRMGFSDLIVAAAWQRAGGCCECTSTDHGHSGRCNEQLEWDDRGRDRPGAWDAHHLSPGGGSVANCEILCWPCHEETF